MGIRHNLLTVMVVFKQSNNRSNFNTSIIIMNYMMAKLRCLNTVQPYGSRKSSSLQFVSLFLIGAEASPDDVLLLLSRCLLERVCVTSHCFQSTPSKPAEFSIACSSFVRSSE